jgi:leucine-rich repeat protein SHOC2
MSKCCSLQQLPDTIGQLTTLSSLNLGGCRSLQQVPVSIGQLPALSSLDLSYCSSLQQLPDTIGQLTALSDLDILLQQPAAAARLNQVSDSPQQPGQCGG